MQGEVVDVVECGSPHLLLIGTLVCELQKSSSHVQDGLSEDYLGFGYGVLVGGGILEWRTLDFLYQWL